jgi:hypothetical protein
MECLLLAYHTVVKDSREQAAEVRMKGGGWPAAGDRHRRVGIPGKGPGRTRDRGSHGRKR